MRRSEFWDLAAEVFGGPAAASLARDLVVGALADRTAEQALADGVPPREVWFALCDAMDVPADRRWGRDPTAERSASRAVVTDVTNGKHPAR